MPLELLDELKKMDVEAILIAIAEAKSGSKDAYHRFIPEITRRDAAEWLDLFIIVAEQGAAFEREAG